MRQNVIHRTSKRTAATPPSGLSRLKILGVVTLVVALSAGSAWAISLKGMMNSFRDTTSSAKATAASFDLNSAQKILREYAAEGRAADKLYAGGGSAKAKDLDARFVRFASLADSAAVSVTDRASFKTAFATIVGECRSCHSAYK